MEDLPFDAVAWICRMIPLQQPAWTRSPQLS
jgi:hypothetical protein